jgi:hypothetical protein
MRILFAGLLLAAAAIAMSPPPPAYAQATCRQKCMDEENACLTRTGNKGQCGERAKVCVAKCK